MREAGSQTLAERGPKFRGNMFDGIQAEAVEVKALDPVRRIFNQVVAGLGLVVIEAGEKRFKPSGKLSLVVPFTQVFASVGQGE